MSDELDLTNSRIISEDQIYLSSIKESIGENFPNSNIKEDLGNLNLVFDDLLDKEKLQSFLNHLIQKYPEV
jgi:hypothetical protein